MKTESAIPYAEMSEAQYIQDCGLFISSLNNYELFYYFCSLQVNDKIYFSENFEHANVF